jgi:DNA-directed RNA polymerase specialized sigma24 family protein
MENNALNVKIEKALRDKDITKIMNKASKRFNNTLDQDSIYTCQLNALWKSFVNFKPNKNTKFTTYLYRGVFIECLKEVKFLNKSKFVNCKLHDNIQSCGDDTKLMFEILDEIESDEDKEIVLDRISRMTINEIAQKNGVSRETVRKKLKKITSIFRNKFI